MITPRAHDLLRISGPEAFKGTADRPAWISDPQFAVVRRCSKHSQWIAVGVRGRSRDQRFATWIEASAIQDRITPERLVEQRAWLSTPRFGQSLHFAALDRCENLLSPVFEWGPVGSTGFELASGLPTLTEASDLDLLIRSPESLTHTAAKQILEALLKLPVRLDVQLETPNGAIALAEWANKSSRKIALRTLDGPKLVENPWATL